MKICNRVFISAVTAFLLLPSASALCVYHGKLYAKTSLAEEFADASWVLRAKVIAADNHSSTDASWTIYHLQVLTAYKGKTGATVDVFTYRNSGGFYLEGDVAGEYLLFLNPLGLEDKAAVAAKEATEVNYSCGQSKAWSAVTVVDRQELSSQSARR